jgi:aminopeptidase N
MRNLLFYLGVLAFLMGCRSKQVVMMPEMDFEQLDTLVITAPRPITPGAAQDTYQLPVYRPSAKRMVDLIHTRLDLRFDWEKEEVIGTAALSLKPYFYTISEVVLDAQDMRFDTVRFVGAKDTLAYEYDGAKLTIALPRPFTRDETLDLEIAYHARPKGNIKGGAITSDQGLFFINPTGEHLHKPQQIWTQGETEFNSRWFPTVDKPNERCTQEVLVTVEERFTTLSNGLLINSQIHDDGTRTDHWKLEKPHAPYLFMLAIGEFAKVSETWKDLPVEYYVEPAFEEDAQAIFPYTPEMLEFFSDKLDFEYPWSKYAQVVVRDFVSGAMENTTAVTFGDFMQAPAGDLVDNLLNEKIVAHEMMHHWFGDLVTCESWANLTLNEGFANYSEYLWLEHKYGKDEADYHWYSELNDYLYEAKARVHPLIYFGYEDKENMFDRHSYNKGGLVLHMLRKYVGDEAFWAALNKYLHDNAYSDVEADELRLAFEEVTGEDLNWFFDQWYFGEGHPVLYLRWEYVAEQKELVYTIEQAQSTERMEPIFQFPVTLQIHLSEDEVLEKEVWVDERKETVRIPVDQLPQLVLFDPDRTLLCERQEQQDMEDYVYQYYHGGALLNRYEALQVLVNEENEMENAVFEDALADPFWVIRRLALENTPYNEATRIKLRTLATDDPHSVVRAGALERVAEANDSALIGILDKTLRQDRSNFVKATALDVLRVKDPKKALDFANAYRNSRSEMIHSVIGDIFRDAQLPTYADYFKGRYMHASGFDALYLLESFAELSRQREPLPLQPWQEAVDFLEGEATNQKLSQWNRLGAMKGLNDLYEGLKEKLESISASSDQAEAEALCADILKKMDRIREMEEDTDLKSIYQSFPGSR